MSKADMIANQIEQNGSTCYWYKGEPCPYVDTSRPQAVACRVRPVNNCPTCGGKGVVYETTPTVIKAIVRTGQIRTNHHRGGQFPEADGTFLVKPLGRQPFQMTDGQASVADIFLHYGQWYAAMSQVSTPEHSDEVLAWRFPVKLIGIPAKVSLPSEVTT